MLIKIAKNGIESEWFQLTKKRHRTLLLEKPDAVFVHIDSLYPKSPESGQIVEFSLLQSSGSRIRFGGKQAGKTK